MTRIRCIRCVQTQLTAFELGAKEHVHCTPQLSNLRLKTCDKSFSLGMWGFEFGKLWWLIVVVKRGQRGRYGPQSQLHTRSTPRILIWKDFPFCIPFEIPIGAWKTKNWESHRFHLQTDTQQSSLFHIIIVNHWLVNGYKIQEFNEGVSRKFPGEDIFCQAQFDPNNLDSSRLTYARSKLLKEFNQHKSLSQALGCCRQMVHRSGY